MSTWSTTFGARTSRSKSSCLPLRIRRSPRSLSVPVYNLDQGKRLTAESQLMPSRVRKTGVSVYRTLPSLPGNRLVLWFGKERLCRVLERGGTVPATHALLDRFGDHGSRSGALCVPVGQGLGVGQSGARARVQQRSALWATSGRGHAVAPWVLSPLPRDLLVSTVGPWKPWTTSS
jgi:hypothetical protein